MTGHGEQLILPDLEENVDYLYCPICKKHIPCVRVDPGRWEVQCPGCAGECVLCDCYLAKFCFGKRDEFPPISPPIRT